MPFQAGESQCHGVVRRGDFSMNGKATIMGDKSSQKSNVKKEGKSLKEKRSAKKAKAADKGTIPTTGR
jgi:hypothetical protein